MSLPYLPELLLLQKSSASSALCCFTGLARHSRSRRRPDREPLELTSMADAEAAAAAAVQVYEPRSSLSGGRPRPICTTEEPPLPQSLAGGRRSMSVTLPTERQHRRQQLWSTLDLPSLLGSVLGWQTGSSSRDGAGADPRRRRSVAALPAAELQQRRTWNFGDSGGSADSVDGCRSAVEFGSVSAERQGDGGADAKTVAKIGTVANGHALENDTDGNDEENSDIVDIYLNSILDVLPDSVDAGFAIDADAAGVDAAEVEIDIDIDELLQLGGHGGDTPIGESTARGGDEEEAAEASSSLSETELARAAEASTGPAEEASDGAAAAADASDGGKRRRLSDTGSELATEEFCYLRLRVLPDPRQTSDGSARGGGIVVRSPPESPPLEQPAWPGDAARKRLHRRRQSYRMDTEAPAGGRALPDWIGDDGGPVLLSARPPPPPPPIPSLPPPPLDVVDAATAAATEEGGGGQCPRPLVQTSGRAVIFHSAGLADRAAYLVNFLSSSGQPACRWSRLLREHQRRRPRRSRLADRLCGRPQQQLQLADAKAALCLCATSGHLPIFLQPSAAADLPAAAGESGKFVGHLRAALAELPPPRLPAGLVVVVFVSAGDAGSIGDSGWAAAAAGASTPTLTVVDVAGAASSSSSEPPGLDCCRAVLAASRQCAALAAATNSRAAQPTEQQQCK